MQLILHNPSFFKLCREGGKFYGLSDVGPSQGPSILKFVWEINQWPELQNWKYLNFERNWGCGHQRRPYSGPTYTEEDATEDHGCPTWNKEYKIAGCGILLDFKNSQVIKQIKKLVFIVNQNSIKSPKEPNLQRLKMKESKKVLLSRLFTGFSKQLLYCPIMWAGL